MVSDMLPGGRSQRVVPAAWTELVQLALATPVVLWGGWPFFERGWASVVNRHLNMFTLIAMGVGAAFVYSVVATLAPGISPARRRADTAAGRACTSRPPRSSSCSCCSGRCSSCARAAARARRIRKLLGLAPKTARRVALDGLEMDVPLEDVRVGDPLRVRPGERVPVDGVVHRRPQRRWTSRWSPASRSRSRRRQAIAVTGGTINGTGALRDGRERVGTRHAPRADRAHGQRGAALARADSAAGRHRSRPGSCPSSSASRS